MFSAAENNMINHGQGVREGQEITLNLPGHSGEQEIMLSQLLLN